MRRVILLGTGTGVGKTYVGSRLARSWSKRGRCLVLKPIESGVSEVNAQSPTDADTLAGRAPEEPWERGRIAGRQDRILSPSPRHFLALPDAISPHLAARRVGVDVDLGGAADWVRSWENSWEEKYTTLHDNTQNWLSLVETAGGAFSPLSAAGTCVDFAKLLDPALWILVAPDSLGVLHDVRATLLALSTVGRRVDAVVLSSARETDASTGTNASELSQIVFPALGSAAPLSEVVLTVGRGEADLTALADLIGTLGGNGE